MVTIGLTIIVRDRAEELQRLLDSCAPVKLDEIVICDTGSRDDSIERVASKYRATYVKHTDPNPEFVKQHGHISDFSSARNTSFAVAKSDWLIWLDSDDELDATSAGNIRRLVEIADSKGYNMIIAKYDYAFDDMGNIVTTQWRERVFRNGCGFKWMAPVHEVCMDNEANPFKSVRAKPEEFLVQHKSKDTKSGGWKDERNLAILEYHLKKDGDIDPRMWKKLGMARRGLGRYKEAIEAYSRHIKLSNWDDDVYMSQVEMLECYMGLGDYESAMGVAKEAIFAKPQYPQAYLGAAVCEMKNGNYDKAIFWCGHAENAPETTEGIGFNPSGCKQTLYSTLFDCYAAKGNWPQALKALEAMKDVYQDREKYERILVATKTALRDKVTYEAFLRVLEATALDQDPDKVQALLKASPNSIRDFPELLPLRRKHPPKDRPTLAILCPQTEPAFGPGSQDSGIGGSEEAVIFLSQELAKAGYYVDVFVGNLTKEGEFGGVRWYPYGAYRHRDFYDVAVIWRYVQIAERPINARLTVAWLHDLPHRVLYTPNVMRNIQKFIFLSKYHRRQYGWIPEDKVIYSKNALDPGYFAEPKNDPRRVIFTSNPTRGLLSVLKMWPQIRQATGAELHTYYGITSVTARAAEIQPQLKREIQEIQKLLVETPGVIDHGMIGQKELAEENAKAGIWLYPTCVTGDTLIDMPRDYAKYPRGVPIAELEGKSGDLVWTFNEQTGRFELKQMLRCWKSKENTEIVRVIWDDGTSLYCTPEHRVMTYKRGWVEAKDLLPGESAVSLKKHAQIEVSVGLGPWQTEHRLIAETLFGKIPTGHHVDHIDGNCLNNSPENLQLLSKADHARKTFTGIPRTRQSSQRRVLKFQAWAKTPEGKADLSRRGAERARKFWASMTLEQRTAFVEKRAKKRASGIRRAVAEMSPERRAAIGARGRKTRWNHKVVRVEPAGVADVYDMAVNDNHNFIAGGVVVHNCFPEISCISAMRAQAMGAIPICSNFGALHETVQYGLKMGEGPDVSCMHQEAYQDLVIRSAIELIKNPKRQEDIRREMIPWARKTFLWSEVAQQWYDLFEGKKECSQVKPKSLEQALRTLMTEESLTSATT